MGKRKHAPCIPGALIADSMGLGKTVQAIGVINCMPDVKKVIVICPATVKIQWRREFLAWSTRDLQVWPVFSGNWPSIADVVIINPHIMARHQHILESTPWDMIIVDECHHFISYKTIRYKILRKIPGKYKMALTGTPILNRIGDIYPTLNFLDPDRWHSVVSFRRKFSDGAGHSSPEHRSRLQKVLRSTCMIRRLKADVFKDMPKIRRQVIEVDDTVGVGKIESSLLGRDEELYARLDTALVLAKVSDNPEDYQKALADIQQCSLVGLENMGRARRECAIAKLPITINHLESCLESIRKIVVWCHHRQCIETIAAAFPGSVMFYGDTTAIDRDRALDRFINNDDCHLFVASIRAAGTGLDGLQKVCSHVVFHELDWVPKIVEQAEGRTNRIGQTESCLYQYIVVSGTMDASLGAKNVEKLQLSDQCLDDDRDKLLNEPLLPSSRTSSHVNITNREIEERTIDPSQKAAVHECLRFLRDNPPDDADTVDMQIIVTMAGYDRLNDRHGLLGQKLVRRYRKHLPENLKTIALAL